MSSINETAYPQLRADIAEKDLLALFRGDVVLGAEDVPSDSG